jgi:hypothetical protein
MLTYDIYKRIKRILPTFQITRHSGFTNQPSGDGVEVVSNSADDTGYITIWGTDTNGDIQYEELTLTGTDAVATTRKDWDDIFGVFMGRANGSSMVAAAGTITVREASTDQTITTVAATEYSSGMACFYMPGEIVEIYKASGNIFMNSVEVVTEANGWPCQTIEYLKVTDYLYLTSDGTGATSKIKVLEQGA